MTSLTKVISNPPLVSTDFFIDATNLKFFFDYSNNIISSWVLSSAGVFLIYDGSTLIVSLNYTNTTQLGTFTITSFNLGSHTTPTTGNPYNFVQQSSTTSRDLVTTKSRRLSTLDDVSGAIPVNLGGTGATTLTGVLIGNGTSAITAVTAPSSAIVGISDSQALTNKTIDVSNNTFTNIVTSGSVEYQNVTGTTITISALSTPVVLNPTTTTSSLGSSVFSTSASGRLTYTGATTQSFLVRGICSIKMASGTSRNTNIYLYKSGSAITNAMISGLVQNTTDHTTFSIQTLVSLATNNYVEAFIELNSGTVVNYTITSLNLTITNI